MTRLSSQRNLERKSNHCIQYIELNTKEGCKLIGNKHQPIKAKTMFNEILQFFISLEKLLDKRCDIFFNLEFCRHQKIRQRDYFTNLETHWLQYIYGFSKHDGYAESDTSQKARLQSQLAKPQDL